MLLTQEDVRKLAIQAGFTDAQARIASAIAMVEAPGPAGYCDSSMVGDQILADGTWGFSYGQFQVRSLRSSKGTGSYRDELRLSDPLFNTQSAYTVFKLAGYRFDPWSTFVSGQYRAYMQDQFPPTPGTYVVIAGDTLIRIAAKLSAFPGVAPVSWQQIAGLNSIVSPYIIRIGQVLQLPYLDYTVRAGDTLSGIGKRAGVAWTAIASYNDIPPPYVIYPGQKLRIPKPQAATLSRRAVRRLTK